MKKELIFGIVIGAVVGWFFTKKHYEAEYELIEEPEEFTALKEEGAKLFDRTETIRKNKEKIMERKGPRVNVVENVKMLDSTCADENYGEVYEDEMEPTEKRADIELIDEDSYDEEYGHHDKIELQYHVEDDMLYDSSGSEELPISTIGRSYIDSLRNGNRPFMYIRDHKLEIDYLVERCSIHDNIPEYHSLTSAYNEEKEKILSEKNGGK